MDFVTSGRSGGMTSFTVCCRFHDVKILREVNLSVGSMNIATSVDEAEHLIVFKLDLVWALPQSSGEFLRIGWKRGQSSILSDLAIKVL